MQQTTLYSALFLIALLVFYELYEAWLEEKGNPELKEKLRNSLVSVIIGFIVIFGFTVTFKVMEILKK